MLFFLVNVKRQSVAGVDRGRSRGCVRVRRAGVGVSVRARCGGSGPLCDRDGVAPLHGTTPAPPDLLVVVVVVLVVLLLVVPLLLDVEPHRLRPAPGHVAPHSARYLYLFPTLPKRFQM